MSVGHAVHVKCLFVYIFIFVLCAVCCAVHKYACMSVCAFVGGCVCVDIEVSGETLSVLEMLTLLRC